MSNFNVHFRHLADALIQSDMAHIHFLATVCLYSSMFTGATQLISLLEGAMAVPHPRIKPATLVSSSVPYVSQSLQKY
uniref:Uncharacterized protein n=1 Tax=Anguilla anguilla TaxID=7936 RepID=A0A0E9QFD2_ANGAN